MVAGRSITRIAFFTDSFTNSFTTNSFTSNSLTHILFVGNDDALQELVDNSNLIQPSSSTTTIAVGDEDELELQKMGYKQELYRGFSAFMSFSFCFTAVAVVSSLTGLFTYALETGGPVVIVWSWILGSILTIIVTLNMAEICSTFPSAGSVYHWAGSLAPEESAPFYSYITGWVNFVGNTAADAFFSYTFAASVNSALVMAGHEPLVKFHQILIAIAVTALWSLQNLLRIDKQGWINNFASFWQVASTISIVATLLLGCQGSESESSASSTATLNQVFFTFYNGTGFETNFYVVLIGMLTTLYSFTGYEAAAHMSEETRKAKISSPWGILYTSLATAVIGFLYLMGLLFTTAHRIDDVISNEMGVFDVFLTCSGYGPALTLTILLVINMYFSGMSSITVTTRIGFAMARDGAFPGSSYIRSVTRVAKAPIGAIILVFVADVLLLLLSLVNDTAFTAITSMSTIGYQISYAIPIFLRITHARNSFELCDFNLGRMGNFLGWISFTFLSVTSLLFLLPTRYPIDSVNMNYTGLVLLFIALIGTAHWQLSAKYWFVGPKRFQQIN